MAEEKESRKALSVKNLAELKRVIQPGTEFLTTAHSKHPDMVGLVRVVSEVQSNAFFSKIKDQPEHKFSTSNHGRGFRTDFEKASNYVFEGTTVKVLDSRKRDGSVLFAFEVYDREMTMKESETKPMKIKEITADDLRRMADREGLILQGCGGSLAEWVDGINDMLTEDGILKDGTRFHDCSTFEHDGVTCLLFPFSDDVKLDGGKLAMWRLQTHGNFGGTWLSDYVPNRLGGFAHEQTQECVKPDCELIGQDGNIYNLMGIASRTLKDNGMEQQAEEMVGRITGGDCHDYHAALGIIGEYVTITGPAEQEHSYSMEMGGLS